MKKPKSFSYLSIINNSFDFSNYFLIFKFNLFYSFSYLLS